MLICCVKTIFRYFHFGQLAAENFGVWVWHPRMLELCWPSQVCIIFPSLKPMITKYMRSINQITTDIAFIFTTDLMTISFIFCLGFGVLVYQLAIYPFLAKYFGPIKPFRPTAVCTNASLWGSLLHTLVKEFRTIKK